MTMPKPNTTEPTQKPFQLLNVQKVCEMLDVSAPTVYRLADANEIEFFKVGNQRRFSLESIIAYLNRQAGKKCPPPPSRKRTA